MKISDFGLSRHTHSDSYQLTNVASAKLPIRWSAPESLQRGHFSHKTDIWSFGVFKTRRLLVKALRL